jgi:integrase
MPKVAMRLAGKAKRGLTKRIAFNVTNLTDATCPAGKPRVYIHDSKTPGLALLVTDKGAKSFYLYRRIDGKPERVRIGGFPEVSVEQARRIVATWQGQIASGQNPAIERKTISKSATLLELWERWKSDHAEQRLRRRTIETDESRFMTCFPDWQGRRIASIRESDVRAKHAEIGKIRGHVTANRAIQLLRRLFYFARIEPNPAAKKAVQLFRETTRSRFLQPDELPKLFAALDAEPNETIRDFIYLSLWTGQRRSNVQSMRWDELNLPGGTWTIPAEKTKAHQPIIVHLTAPAMEILNRRHAAKGDSEYILPGRGVSGHLTEPKFAWKAILKRAGVENLTIHDLRRSTASWMAIGGTSLPIIGAALGHKSPTATAVYARLHGSSVAAALDNAVEAMMKAKVGW